MEGKDEVMVYKSKWNEIISEKVMKESHIHGKYNKENKKDKEKKRGQSSNKVT